MKTIKIKILLVLMLTTQYINSTVVIWDIGETILKTNNTSAAFNHFGVFNTMSYMFSFFNKNGISMNNFKTHMKDFFLDTLSLIPSPCKSTKSKSNAKGVTGKPLPALQRDYLLGEINSKQVLNSVTKWVKKNKKHFTSKKQREIFVKMVELYFDPVINIKNQKYTHCLDLLKKAYEAKDANGKRKNTCIILSNWPKDSLDGLRSNFKEIFEYSDMQLFSCNEKLLKPAPDFFELCLFFKQNKNDVCVFIDDQEDNRQSAQELGIIAVHPDNAEKTLKQYSVI